MMLDDENEAWERMRAAILRCRAEPTDENFAAVRRSREELERAMETRHQPNLKIARR